MKIDVNIKNKTFEAIYDSGSMISLINESVLKKLRATFFRDKRLLSTVNGSSFSAGRAFLRVKIGKLISYIDFHVIKSDKFKFELLIGLDAIRKFRLMQSENLEVFQRDPTANTYLRINKPTKLIKMSESSKVDLVERGEFVQSFVNLCTSNDENDHDLSAEQKKKLQSLVDENINCFATDKFDVGRVKSGEAHIRLMGDQIAAQRPYRCSMEDKREIEKQVKELLEHGLISESCSPFAAPVTLAFKKSDGARSRFCIDFRLLNKLAVRPR